MEKKEHPQAKWLRAIADGETLQLRGSKSEWFDVGAQSILTVLCTGPMEDIRIKPRTITVGKYGVAEPMRVAPKKGTNYYAIGSMAVDCHTWFDEFACESAQLTSGMCWLKREDAELAAKAISELLTGK